MVVSGRGRTAKGKETMGVVVPVGETLAVLRWILDGDPEEMVSTIGVNYEGSTDPNVVAAQVFVAAAGSASICDETAMVGGWTFVGVTTYTQDDPGMLVGEFNDPIVSTSGDTNALPSNCAFLVHKSTASSGRQNKGRMYLPPFLGVESEVSRTGLIIANYSAYNARVEDFFAGLVSQDLNPRLFHSTPIPATPITALTLDTQIATQRRRMRN